MNGYGSHTFKMVNKEGKAIYCKFHYKTDQKIDCFLQAEADKMASSNPDYGIQVWNVASLLFLFTHVTLGSVRHHSC